MLQFDYEEVNGQNVSGVVGCRAGLTDWWTIAFLIEDRAVVLRVDPDTDEVIVTLEEAPDLARDWDDVAELAPTIGSALGWCWIGRNYLGYLDMFMLSFSGLEPQVCFVAAASTLTIRHIRACSDTSVLADTTSIRSEVTKAASDTSRRWRDLSEQ